MRIIQAEFVKGAISAEQFPELSVPEFAFFGRSNAGKSSLINMLVNRKNLVKTGARPGMTRKINFFLVNKPAGAKTGLPVSQKGAEVFALTDLPGYGYAKISGGMTLQIDKMLYEYCTNRPRLKVLFFLMDMRRSPSDVEKRSVDFFQNIGIEVIIVGTKSDKIGKNEQVNTKRAWADFFGFNTDVIITTSAAKKTGRDSILHIISQRCMER